MYIGVSAKTIIVPKKKFQPVLCAAVVIAGHQCRLETSTVCRRSGTVLKIDKAVQNWLAPN